MIGKRFASTFALAAVMASPGLAFGQAADAALKDRVSQLVEKLDAPKMEARKAAEDALIKLGPRVLPLLPEGKGTAERDQRLEKIRVALRQAMDQTNLGATAVTLKVKGMRLSEVVQKLQAQSGNPITDERDADGPDSGNPALDLDLDKTPFLEALEIVAKQAKISTNYYSGNGSIALIAGGMAAAPDAPAPNAAFTIYPGPFKVALKQVGVVRDLQLGTSSATVQFEVGWEPRLRPMLMALKAKGIKIVDDQGKDVEVQVMNESTDVVLRPENPVADLNLTLKAPDRAAKALKSVKVVAEMTIPAGLKTFRFPTLAVKETATIAQGDVSVSLEGTEVDEQVWKVNVVLAYPGEGPAFESYRQGLFNNRVWLQKADGSKFEHNGGFSNTSSDEGKLGFEYMFVDAPGNPADYQLVYETPSEVKTIPLEFEFKDVPLP